MITKRGEQERTTQSFYALHKHWRKRAKELGIENILLHSQREIFLYFSSLNDGFSKRVSSCPHDFLKTLEEIYKKAIKIIEKSNKEVNEAMNSVNTKEEIELANIADRCKENLKKMFEEMEKKICGRA